MDKKLQTQVLALAMQIIGIKDPNQFKQAMTIMSEQGRTKFLNKCAEIIQSGDTSEENIAQAQQEAQQAIQEGQQGQQAILAKHGNRVTYLNRFYSGGTVKTFDGGYMKLKNQLNKNQVDGKESIGLYKGQWMYLNSEKIAVPHQNKKQKSEDGSTHVNRAYNGMLIPKPNNYIQQYSIGGIFNSIGDWMKDAGSTIKTGLNSAAKWVDKNQNFLKVGAGLGMGLFKTIQGMNRSNRYDPMQASADIQAGNYLMNESINPFLQIIKDIQKYKSEQASKNGQPNSKLQERLAQQLDVNYPKFQPVIQNPNPEQYPIPEQLGLDTSLQYPSPQDNTLSLNYKFQV